MTPLESTYNVWEDRTLGSPQNSAVLMSPMFGRNFFTDPEAPSLQTTMCSLQTRRPSVGTVQLIPRQGL